VSNKRTVHDSRSFHDPKISFKNPPMFRDAGREYDVSLPDGTKGKLGFALGDLALDNAFSRHARSLQAIGFGVVSFAGLPGAPQSSMLWTQTPTDTVMTLADGDRQPRGELQRLIARYLAIYFSDIAAIAPELGEPRIRPDIEG
jgi:hypothetical protein